MTPAVNLLNTPADVLESMNRIAADGKVPIFWRTVAEHHAKLLGDALYQQGRRERQEADTRRLVLVLTGKGKEENNDI